MHEVEASILASSCAFPLAGLPVNVPSLGYCVDGMFSDFQLIKVGSSDACLSCSRLA